MKRTSFLRKPIAHTFKRPRSKVEEPDGLFHWNPPSNMIVTQPPGKRGKLKKVKIQIV
jgi:hypothetical protein